MATEAPLNSAPSGQRLLIPAYFYPFGARWQEMCDELADRGIDAVIIMNPASGPGSEADPVYTETLAYCRQSDQTVIGYVDTGYRSRKLSAVKADVEAFFALYPGIEGIFLDQVSNEPGRTVKRYYRDLYRFIKERWPGALVVGNPGVPALTPWQVRGGGIADVLCVFEMPAADYAEWTPPDWIASRERERFAHLVYATADADATTLVATATAEKNAGWLFVTQGVMPNPWALPPETAMYDHLRLARHVIAAS